MNENPRTSIYSSITMTNVRRPIFLHFGPANSRPQASSTTATSAASTAICSSPKALSPTGDSLPSQIMPHLFVGNLQQTNRETLNRLNISYILSLGLLPLISTNTNQNSTTPSPNSPTPANSVAVAAAGSAMIYLPPPNSSKDFKIRLRSSSSSLPPTTSHSTTSTASADVQPSTNCLKKTIMSNSRDENKGVKMVRLIHCKCINIADNFESERVLTKFFDESHQFIEEARRKKCNILVHCLAGISRSPAIAIAYMMRENSLRLQEAYNIVKQCRPQIDPNFHFMGQLMSYEKSLGSMNSMSLIDDEKKQRRSVSSS